ncbi:MAG: DUF5654 family protein [Candidatus Aenigmatarchaeota archaeon]
MADKKDTKSDFNIRTFFITSIVTSMSLVVGLFWKDAISIALTELIPEKNGLYSSFTAAIIATIIIGIAIFILYRSQRVVSKYEKHVKDKIKNQKSNMEEKRKRYSQILEGSEL